MSLQDHVPSLELCRKWKQAGGRQDTEFAWYFDDNSNSWIVFSQYLREAHRTKSVAAPLEGEMMEWMKELFGDIHFNEITKKWFVYPRGEVGHTNIKLPNALMQMAIWQKENEK